ncbi:MAG: flagellar biosynthetic protein FliQ [Hyphomicrobiales bacterium]|nr:flagellar biosynthesis protein FliQ [Alphaproteobacteria bacterium]PCI87791.1 MAG: flagellar biosynthetic protein FliQ [Hyphomicrobiales bacterium]
MNGAETLDYARDAVYVMLLMSGPIMVVALMVGLVIALFQALTQIQEMTLVFVPKIVAIFVTLLLLLPFMASTLAGFMNRTMENIIIVGGTV